MRSRLPAIALGAALAVAALVGVMILRPGADPTGAERADALAAELRCPDCQGLSVRDAPTSSAAEIRRQVSELIAGGASDAEVRDHFVSRYGDWILLAPSSPLPWIIPLAVVAVAALGLVAWLARQRSPPPPVPVTPEERRRLNEEVDALDA